MGLGFNQMAKADMNSFGALPGYTDNVAEEVPLDPQEMYLMEKPISLRGPTLHRKIFNDTLTEEFQSRYRDEFGRTEQEENYYLINKQGYYQTPTGLTTTQKDQQRRDFAQYMVKRLVEFHTENILKTEPQFRHVYEVKQAISNFKVAVTETTRLDMQYSFVGNFFTATVTNPISPVIIGINMDPASLTPTSPREIDVHTYRPLTSSLIGEIGFRIYDRALRLLLGKTLTPRMSVNVSQTVRVTEKRDIIDQNRESLSLVGFSYVF